jgi:phage tail tape-measure protein
VTAGQENRGPLCGRTQRTFAQPDEARKMDAHLHRSSLQKRTKQEQRTVRNNGTSPQDKAQMLAQRCDAEGLVRHERSANMLGGLSALLHGVVLATAIPFMVKVTMPPPQAQKQPFR